MSTDTPTERMVSETEMYRALDSLAQSVNAELGRMVGAVVSSVNAALAAGADSLDHVVDQVNQRFTYDEETFRTFADGVVATFESAGAKPAPPPQNITLKLDPVLVAPTVRRTIERSPDGTVTGFVDEADSTSPELVTPTAVKKITRDTDGNIATIEEYGIIP